MRFELSKRLLWQVAQRGLAGLLVFALVCSLSLDIGHHAVHAGQSHASHQSHAPHHAHGSHHASDAAHATEQAHDIAGQQHDQHSGASGTAADCDCCSMSCVALVIFSDPPSVDVPAAARTTVRLVNRSTPEGLAHSLYRPPITIL